MTNMQARLIAAALVIVAGAIVAAVRDLVTPGSVLIAIGGVLFLVDYRRSWKA